MRTILSALVMLLVLVVALGYGFGFWIVSAVGSQPGSDGLSIVGALAAATVPFAIGTVALGALAVVAAIDVSARDQVAATNRNTEVMINEARFAEHHVAARARSGRST